jgi:hypothetical protein
MAQGNTGEGGSDSALWVTAHYDLLRIAGFAIAVAIIFITGIDLIPVVAVGIVLAAYLWGLAEIRRRTTPADPAAVADLTGAQASLP